MGGDSADLLQVKENTRSLYLFSVTIRGGYCLAFYKNDHLRQRLACLKPMQIQTYCYPLSLAHTKHKIEL